MEFENMKEALIYLLDVANSKGITTDGENATAEDIQELVREAAISMADLLGVSELYLNEVN